MRNVGVEVGGNVTRSPCSPYRQKPRVPHGSGEEGGLVRVASVATEKSHDRRGISDLNVTESPRTTRVSAHLSGHAFSAREGDAPAGLMTPDFGLGNLVVWPAA